MADNIMIGSNDKKVEKLFIEQNVSEIKQLETKTKLDIERKKEELRQLVGEQYRDMIEAADSVMYMNEASSNVVQTLLKTHTLCHQLQQTYYIKGTGGQQAPPTLSKSQSVAMVMRLIIDLQEKIWGCLEEGQYILATVSYLLLRHTISHLEDTQWPSVAVQLWCKVPSIKTAIIEACRRYLGHPHTTQPLSQEVLTSIILLGDDSGIQQCFVHYLEDRQSAIEHLFVSLQANNVKDVISEALELLRETLTQVAHLFYSNSSSTTSNIHQSLYSINRDLVLSLVPQQVVARLPNYITDYLPKVDDVTDVPVNVIYEKTSEWINKCYGSMEKLVKAILVRVHSLATLGEIRSTLYHLLSQVGGDTSPSELWSVVCTQSLGYNISLYDQYVQPHLLARAKAIVDDHLGKVEESVTGLLHLLVQQHETHSSEFLPDSDVMQFLWSTKDEGKWVDVCGSEGRGNSGMLKSLEMKAKNCTPQVFNFCRNVSDQLQVILVDIEEFSKEVERKEDWSSGHKENDDGFPFNQLSDLPHLIANVQDSLTELMARLLTLLDKMVEDIKGSPSSLDGPSSLDRILLLGRLCQCLPEFTPSLKHLLSLQQSMEHRHSWKKGPTKGGVKRLKNTTSSLQPQLITLLQQWSDKLYRFWTAEVAKSFIVQFKGALTNERNVCHLLSFVNWEDIVITEESESGENVSSTIRLPSQASVYVVSLMFSLCQEISRVGGYCISKDILKELIHVIYDGITDCYIELLNYNDDDVALSQNCSLQLLFDYRFLSSILATPTLPTLHDQKNKPSKVLELLQSQIDPFDYDVFVPHLSQLLNRQLQRTAVLFGSLSGIRGGAPVSSAGRNVPVASSTEKHVVLPLSVSLPRVPLLPNTSNSNSSQELHRSTLHTAPMPSPVPSFLNVFTTLQHVQ